MQKSVLIEIVQSLNKKEIRELNKWLHSPAHNQREDTVRLFDFLVKYLSKNEGIPTKEQAWKSIFPGKPYDDAYMRQVMFFLLKPLEEYLVFAESLNSPVHFQLSLMKTYRSRNLEKSYKQSYRLALQAQKDQPLRDSDYLRNQFYIEQEYGQWSRVIENASVNLQETADSLEKWFLAEKLHVAYAMLAHRSVYKTAKYDEGMLKQAFEYAETKGLLEEPAIALYYYAYLALTQPNEESYFDKLEYLINIHESQFNQSDFRTFYVAAINYCVPKINQGRLEFARRAFELSRKGLEKQILFENGVLTRYTFGNAVAFAIKIGEFAWAERFIEDYQKYLEEKERNSIANFNLSRVYFEKGDYKKAQSLLTQFEYDDMLFNIIAKTMLLKIYYETDEFDALESLIDSMRIYLQRKEALDPTRKAAYKNLLSLMKKMLQINIFSRAQREKFRETVVGTNPLAERDWMLKQLDKK